MRPSAEIPTEVITEWEVGVFEADIDIKQF